MDETLIEDVGPLVEGDILKRENRFILKVAMESGNRKVYLPNPGALSTVLSPGRKILSMPADNEERKTDFTAFAIHTGDFFVTVDSSFPNDIFSKILERGVLKRFEDYRFTKREPNLPDHGRADFLLIEENTETESYVEVKSCTHVENGTAKFPDRPTKRGRRHLRSLMKIVEKGLEGSIVFIIQRPDAERFRPFRKIDPEFSKLLKKADDVGVYIAAISTKFDPPKVSLRNGKVPVELNR